MNCDMELHEGLIELGDVVCPFCKRTLEDSDEKPQDSSLKYDVRLSELWNRSRIQNGERIC